jgi:23S rRNA (guanosine2251-2'-O)-methyltransferase
MARPTSVHGLQPVLELLRSRPAAVREILVHRALSAEGRDGELLRLVRRRRIPMRQTSRREIDDLAGGRGHQGVIALLAEDALPQVDDPLDLVDAARAAGRDPFLLLLDGVQDPGNLGALVRSAWALGADGVIVPRHRSAPLTPVAIKASAGSALRCPVVSVTNLARTLTALEEAGVWSVGADVAEGAEDLWSADLSGPIALVIGAEGKGLRRLTRERCARRVKIPMAREAESLNASVAGGILLYEVWRQRLAAEGQGASHA